MVKNDNTDALILCWKRFFARVTDWSLYNLIVYFVVYVVLNSFPVKDVFASGLFTYAPWLIMIFLEPLLLNKFGTTVGKYLFGISVLSVSGNKLNYTDGLRRTFKMFVLGLGLMVPVICVICAGSSFWKAKDNQFLWWENGTEILTKKVKIWIGLGALIGVAVCFVLSIYMELNAIMPKHRGTQLSKEEVEENYQAYLDYFSLTKTPEILIEEKDGAVSSVRLSVEQTDGERVCGDYGEAVVCAVLAYAGAYKDVDIVDMTESELLFFGEDGYFLYGYDVYGEDIEDSFGDFLITGDVSYSGYEKEESEIGANVEILVNGKDAVYLNGMNPTENAENPYYSLNVEIKRK